MRYSLDTNVIISHFKADKFSDDTDRFFAWIKDFGHRIYIADIVYAELYTGVYLSPNPALEGRRIKNKKKGFKRILPDFVIGAHAEQYSDIFVTWNPSDYDINIAVKTPVEVME